MVQIFFGANYKVIVPLVSFHEEFDLGSIGVNNELVSLRRYCWLENTNTMLQTILFPALVEENGIVKQNSVMCMSKR
jgi:hypothetical protein